MKPIQTDKAPQAIGPYSQGIRVGDLIFFSGQVPLDPKSGVIVGTDIQAQTRKVMENIQGLLQSQGLDFTRVVKSTVFLTNMGDFAAFNEIYASFLKAPYPARSTVQVSALPKGALVEIECVVLAG
ncbi:RidA family protein [bacterium]|nr:RidA family protein [bacterium]